MGGGMGAAIDGDDQEHRVWRSLRPWRRAVRSLPLLVLPVVLVAASGVGGLGVENRAAEAGAAGVVTVGRAVTGRPAILPRRPCGDLASEHLPSSTGVPVRIASARLSDITGAKYCHVNGSIGTGFDFDLRLPRSAYQGQYVQEGCGGFCGFLSPSVPLVADDCPAVTGNTLAVAVDNEGHVASSITDARWAADNVKSRTTFGSGSEHELAAVAKALIADYYGRSPTYSYFDGCSDGGREALIEAQRYPSDFNGILAGAPANALSEQIGEVGSWNIRVNTGPRGREILTAGKLPALHAAVVRACGQGRGYLLDPRTCNFSPSSIQCRGRVTNSCLTAPQVRVVTLLYRGPSDPAGQSLYPGGEPYGSELGWSAWFIKPSGDRHWPQDTLTYQFAINLLRYMAYPTDPPGSYSLSQFHFSLSDYQKLTAISALYDATDPDLSSFAADGGRLIIYQGWADQVIPPFGTVAYYKAVVDSAGSYPASQSFSRLYMIPAQYHCLAGGAPALAGADLLTPLIDWVQRGTVPGPLTLEVAAESRATGETGAGSLSVVPLNPLITTATVPSGLNATYDWVGSFGSSAPQLGVRDPQGPGKAA
jgi:hypothetical protein